jgi:hypothetical protein
VERRDLPCVPVGDRLFHQHDDVVHGHLRHRGS